MNLHFAAPQYVHWIWLVLAGVGLLLWLERRGSDALERFLSRAMSARLVARPSRTQRFLRIGLLGLAGLSLVVALMRPQWGARFVRTPRVGAEIMVCLDVSKSMLAADAVPSRLERAKVEIADLLTYLDGDHVGLVAFAGKATVLCPMTPDFGFLKLALEHAGPHSVARGGTNLEAPLRKALHGFRGEADVSRAILLITDGEDHDSFPLEAAKTAAERGIRILAIGFGDEAGSEILVEDPTTGAREVVRDADGKPVVTRLDGETLREMALATGGAYIPAGTGTLDLGSIYDAHVLPLTRGRLDGRGRLVRNEGFQWAILAGLLFLLASVAVPRTRRLGGPMPNTRSVAAFFVLLAGLTLTAAPARAEEEASLDGLDARARYNRGVEALEAGNLDEAARALEAARRAPGPDGEARFAAAYDLGWVEVRRADGVLAETPETALEHLRTAAEWFRDAVRLRPEREAARHNLDVVTRRVLALSDALSRSEPRDVPARLDELIEAQRALMPELGGALEREREQEPGQGAALSRGEYRRLGVEQRTVLSDLQRLASEVREELDALSKRSEEEQSGESRVRAFQLQGASVFLERASQRLHQARSQLRRRQAGRAFRRGAAGLDELKRARDAFRDPVELLGVLIGEGTRLVQWTGLLAASDVPTPPAWLDVQHVKERQEPQGERTKELVARLRAFVEAPEPEAGSPDKGLAAREALPFLQTADEAYDAVPEALELGDLRTAYTKQATALTALIEARERFLELKGLIEVAYADQVRTSGTLTELLADTELPAGELPAAEVLPLLLDLQGRNVDRCERLASLLRLEEEKLTAEHREAEQQRLAAATTYRERAAAAMQKTLDALTPAEARLAEASTAADEAKEHLGALRRLYFTLVEHLRDTLRRQLELNDQAGAATVHADDLARGEALAPLVPEQAELRELAREIASALEKQAASDPSAAQGPAPDPAAGEKAREEREKLAAAAVLVAEGGDAMEAAGPPLGATPPALEEARTQQNVAAEKLAEALVLLQPPPPPPDPQDGEQEQPQEQPEENEGEQPQDADPSRMLQAVRDREAERRREKEQRRAGYEPVEKDW